MKNKYFYLLLIFIIVVSIFFIVWHKNKEPAAEKEKRLLPITPDLQAKLDQHNLRMQTLKKTEENYQKNKTDAQLEAEKKFVKKLATVSESMLGEINFYGQAVNQYGDPVVGARIRYDAGGATFAKGSGKGETISDEKGMFNIVGKGQGLSVSLSKNNYEFLPDYRFASFVDPEHPRAWPDYNTPDKSYIFKGWKIDDYPKVKKDSKLVGFKPNGKVYTLDFLSAGSIVKKEETQDGDLHVIFNRTEDEWDIEITAINGGLLVTDDIYRNLAPETGYVDKFTYSGTKEGLREVSKNMYFTSRNGELYGTLSMDIIPYYRKKSVIDLSYIVNLEKGRNLAVKKQR